MRNANIFSQKKKVPLAHCYVMHSTINPIEIYSGKIIMDPAVPIQLGNINTTTTPICQKLFID